MTEGWYGWRMTSRRLMPSVLIAAALVMAPFGSNLEFTSLAYAQWPQMLWLFLLLLEPPAESSRRTPLMFLRAIWVVFLTLTNPLSVVLLPLGLAQRVRRTGRLDWVCLVGAVLGYWLVILLLPVEHIAPTFAAVWSEIVPAIGVNVVVEAFVGVGGANALASAGPLVLASIATLLCGGLVAVVRLAWPRSVCVGTKDLGFDHVPVISIGIRHVNTQSPHRLCVDQIRRSI